MRCPNCRKVMLSTSSQTLEDDRGAMTVTRWRCRPCHETAEEIWLSAGYRGSAPMTFRYSVAEPRKPDIAVQSIDTRHKDAWAHAGSC